MHAYRRLTYWDRCQIESLLQVGVPVEGISSSMGFDKSTIYREISRNGSSGEYRAQPAQIKAGIRFRRCRKARIVVPEVEGTLLAFLIERWSPQQIVGRLKAEGVEFPCTQTL